MAECRSCGERMGFDPFTCAACGAAQPPRGGGTRTLARVGAAGMAAAALYVLVAFDRGIALFFAVPFAAVAVMAFAFALPHPASSGIYRLGTGALGLYAVALVFLALRSI